MAKKRHPPHEEHVDESWLIPYADILTLLLALFIVLFAASDVDGEKFEAMIQAFGTFFGSEVPLPPPGAGMDGDYVSIANNFNQLYQDLTDIIRDNDYDEFIELLMKDGLITLRFRDAVLFYPDRSEFIPEGRAILDKLSLIVADLESAVGAISIEGHTANPGVLDLDQRATNFSWRLSNDRALAVLQHFSYYAHFPERKMTCTGRSHFDPIDKTDISRNRRVEIKITRATIAPSYDVPRPPVAVEGSAE